MKTIDMKKELTNKTMYNIIIIEREVSNMRLALDDLSLIIEEMIKEMNKDNTAQLNLDITVDSCDNSVESIDFDIWANGKFVKTILTKTP